MKHEKQNKRVLQDHKKVGQRFIPPFVDKVPNLQEVSYLKDILPDILWIEVISHQAGDQRGVELTLEIAKAANELNPNGHMWLCSSYAQFTTEQQRGIVAKLRNLDEISKLLSPLINAYPECPLAFLCLPQDVQPRSLEDGAEVIAKVITELYDRRSRRATLMQAGAVYIALCTDKLQVNIGTPLAEFSEIERYPATELSKRVAAIIRTFLTATGMLEQDLIWSRYFWNRGYELSPCQLEEIL